MSHSFVDVRATPLPSFPHDDATILEAARKIIAVVAKAETQAEYWAAQDKAEEFLALYGDPDATDRPVGVLKVKSSPLKTYRPEAL